MRFLTQPPSCLLLRALSPLSLLPRNLGPLDKTLRGIVRDPLTNPEGIWYTDGSSFVLDGKRARYAVVSNFETIKAKPLLLGTSAQLAEFIALTQALELGKGKRVAIYRLLLCLPGATCTCSYLESKKPLHHPRMPNQVQ